MKATISKTAGGFALHFVPQAFAAGPIVGAIVLAGAGLAMLFSTIFGHHAKAVAKERSVLCAAVPAANDALYSIDQGVGSGQVTPQQAIAALDSMVGGFRSQVASIMHGNDPMSSGECNAACVMLSQLRAIVELKKSQYQDLASASAAPVSGAVQSVQSAIAAAGLPGWALPAAGFFLLYKLL